MKRMLLACAMILNAGLVFADPVPMIPAAETTEPTPILNPEPRPSKGRDYDFRCHFKGTNKKARTSCEVRGNFSISDGHHRGDGISAMDDRRDRRDGDFDIACTNGVDFNSDARAFVRHGKLVIAACDRDHGRGHDRDHDWDDDMDGDDCKAMIIIKNFEDGDRHDSSDRFGAILDLDGQGNQGNSGSRLFGQCRLESDHRRP